MGEGSIGQGRANGLGIGKDQKARHSLATKEQRQTVQKTYHSRTSLFQGRQLTQSSCQQGVKRGEMDKVTDVGVN